FFIFIWLQSKQKKVFYSFRGIPFAKPPINDLRFKAPEKNNRWTETIDAFDFGNDCIQKNSPTFDPVAIGSEDCLYINVYFPGDCKSINSKTKLPVMISIYGGGFIVGSSRFYGPDFLIETNVIVVTFNYRLVIFGSLSLDLPEYSGNMGMKDQRLALRWVYENTEHFGGDKNKITLAGHSAGAMSVGLHVINSQSNFFDSKKRF
ncbi:juvenile hormone esterase-like, partial [Sitodiplosis mosellana]|uniref:juvenile hormone esterase-like n=1 Tax=Sitodiplosis mosellana TaxID=263140 RepID=UPI0024441734